KHFFHGLAPDHAGILVGGHAVDLLGTHADVLRAAVQIEIHTLLGVVLLQHIDGGGLAGPGVAVIEVHIVGIPVSLGKNTHGNRAQGTHVHGHVGLHLHGVVEAHHIHGGISLHLLAHGGHIHFHDHGGLHTLHRIDLLRGRPDLLGGILLVGSSVAAGGH